MIIPDWATPLEFVKATAAPIAGVVAVWLASRLAVNAFKSQKAIERRLDWHERMHRSIAHVKHWYARSAVPADSVDERQADDIRSGTHKALYDLLAVAAEAAIYAHPKGSDAVWKLRTGLADIEEEWEGLPPTLKKLDRITLLLQGTADVLAQEIRADMKLGALELPNPVKPLSDYVKE